MKDVTKLIRNNIKDLVPYSSARSEFKGTASVFLDANENPFDETLAFNRYPDPQQHKLKSLIAEIKGVDRKNIFIGNGSDEAIDIIIRVFCEPGKDSILTFTPGFGMFKVAAAINNVQCKMIELGHDFLLDVESLKKEITPDVKVVFLCSPNNPTGNSIDERIVDNLCSSTESIIVVDEAYIDYSTRESMLKYLPCNKNLMVLQTLSKAHGGAGLRVGMAFGDEDILRYMNNIKMPYNISGSNQNGALRLLSNRKEYNEMLQTVMKEKGNMWNRLNQYKKIKKVYPSDANFFLIKLDDAEKVYRQLCDSGVIVRNVSSKRGCENCLRITVGTKPQNEKLYDVLDTIIS